jgi:tripartite-type tricarboxylate transporter receptor subunit TctC
MQIKTLVRGLEGRLALRRHSAFLRRCAAAAALAGCCGTVMASGYPDKPVRVIVPFAAGGFTDVVARVLTQQLTASLGQSFITENRPGAGSTIGTDFVAKSAPDGYTLVMLSSNNVTSDLLYKNLPYNPIKDFTPIAMMADAPYVLAVNAEVPAHNVKELVALAKSKPNTINYASSGNGSSQHLMGALFVSLTGAPMVHVPYRGSAQAMQDLAAGFVQTSFAAVSNALAQIRAGKLRALAIAGPRRSPQLPDVPTMEEAGVPGYKATIWLALAGPANMPKDVVARLNAEVAKAMNKPEAKSALAAVGVDVSLSTPDEMERIMVDDARLWGKVINDARITAE